MPNNSRESISFTGYIMIETQVKNPIYQLKDLETSPSINTILNSRNYNILKIDNFSVFNEFGRIDFLSPVDLRDQDIERAISIKHKKIEVYPDAFYREGLNKPRYGDKMNQNARLTFYNFFNQNQLKNNTKEDLIKNLGKKCQDKFCIVENVDFDLNKISILIFGF